MKILWNYCEYNISLSIKMLSNKQLVTCRCVKLLVIGKKEKEKENDTSDGPNENKYKLAKSTNVKNIIKFFCIYSIVWEKIIKWNKIVFSNKN